MFVAISFYRDQPRRSLAGSQPEARHSRPGVSLLSSVVRAVMVESDYGVRLQDETLQIPLRSRGTLVGQPPRRVL